MILYLCDHVFIPFALACGVSRRVAGEEEGRSDRWNVHMGSVCMMNGEEGEGEIRAQGDGQRSVAERVLSMM